MEFDYVEAVFANQSQILGDSTKAGGIELLTSLAEGAGINGTEFAAGMANRSTNLAARVVTTNY